MRVTPAPQWTSVAAARLVQPLPASTSVFVPNAPPRNVRLPPRMVIRTSSLVSAVSEFAWIVTVLTERVAVIEPAHAGAAPEVAASAVTPTAKTIRRRCTLTETLHGGSYSRRSTPAHGRAIRAHNGPRAHGPVIAHVMPSISSPANVECP